jgi:hypothetical protein
MGMYEDVYPSEGGFFYRSKNTVVNAKEAKEMRLRFVTALLCSCLFFIAAAFSQDTTGSIRGLVKDPTGAVVAGATVTITNTDQNVVVRSVKTGSEGQYTAPFLPVGHYSVAVEARGFTKTVIPKVTLNINDQLTYDVNLQVASSTQEVTVNASAVHVDLEGPQAAGLISGQQVRELAVSSRNFVQLVALQPGVTTSLASSNMYVGASNPTGMSNQMNIIVNGNRPTQNNWTVDGADNFDRGSNLTLVSYPSIDSIAEFKVLRSNYLAEHGRSSAGTVTVVTRNGTNDFHGSAYEFFRNDVLNANNYFNRNNLNGTPRAADKIIPRPPMRWNDFGFTLGGPIKKGKTFFFYSQEWRRITYPVSIGPTGILPTTAEMNGVFPTPVCVAFNAAGNCSQTGTTITNIDPTAAAYVKDIFAKLPAPNNPDNTITTTASAKANFREEAVRIDHNFNSKWNMYGRYSDDDIPTMEPRGLYTGENLPGVSNTQSNSPGRTFTAHLTGALSDTLLNDLSYAFTWNKIDSDPIATGALKNSPDVKPNLVYPSNSANVPAIDLCSYTVGPWGCAPSIWGFGPYGALNKNHAWSDNLSKMFGHHALKFGGTFNYYIKNEPGTNGAAYYFDDVASGSPSDGTFNQVWANFLLGRVNTYSQTNIPFNAQVRQKQFEAYAQDEWRFTPKLTLSYGVRYSLFMEPTYANGLLSTFDPNAYDPSKAATITSTGYLAAGTQLPYSNGMIIGGKNSPFGDAVARTPKKNFAPRLGFAYDPFGDGKTSIRGGYGIFYDSPAVNSHYNFETSNPPIVQGTTIHDTNFTNPKQGTTAVDLSPPSVGGPDPNHWSTPYSQMFNLDVQRQLTNTMSLDVGYYGNLGRHLIGVVDINMPKPGAYLSKCLGGRSGTSCTGQFYGGNYMLLNQVRPYQGYDAINLFSPVFTSNYNGLQAQLVKHFSGSSVVTLNYTWSHTLTTASGDYRAAQNTYNLRGDYGNSDFDRRHVFTATYIYTLPFYKSQQGFAGHVLGGWELSGLAYINSGLHYTASISSCSYDPAGLGLCGPTYSGARPDIIGDPNANAPHLVNQWVTAAAFQAVPVGQIRPGNSPRGTIVGPGTVRWDASLYKNTKLSERFMLQFRAEAFNVLNHTNLGLGAPSSPFRSTAISSSLFGAIGTAYEPRQMQLALKLLF